jgi:hypothetical protein
MTCGLPGSYRVPAHGSGKVGWINAYSGITLMMRARSRLNAWRVRVIAVMPARWSRLMAMFPKWP